MFAKVYVALSALVYGAIGALCVVWPEELLTGVNVTAADAVGVVELRAMYGGLELGMAAFLVWCLVRGHLRAGTMAAWLSIGGLGLVRGLAWVAAGMPESQHPWLLIAEGLALVLGPVALRALEADEAR